MRDAPPKFRQKSLCRLSLGTDPSFSLKPAYPFMFLSRPRHWISQPPLVSGEGMNGALETDVLWSIDERYGGLLPMALCARYSLKPLRQKGQARLFHQNAIQSSRPHRTGHGTPQALQTHCVATRRDRLQLPMNRDIRRRPMFDEIRPYAQCHSGGRTDVAIFCVK